MYVNEPWDHGRCMCHLSRQQPEIVCVCVSVCVCTYMCVCVQKHSPL